MIVGKNDENSGSKDYSRTIAKKKSRSRSNSTQNNAILKIQKLNLNKLIAINIRCGSEPDKIRRIQSYYSKNPGKLQPDLVKQLINNDERCMSIVPENAADQEDSSPDASNAPQLKIVDGEIAKPRDIEQMERIQTDQLPQQEEFKSKDIKR